VLHAGHSRDCAVVLLLAVCAAWPRSAAAVPSFARQTGLPCAQCHTLAFGPALTAFGRQFKLNGYTFGSGEQPLPLALMLQGGYTRTAAAQPAPPAPHFSANDNLSVDQASVFVGTRLSEHLGVLAQATYSGDSRHFSWDNTDLRYARPVTLFGSGAVLGISVNNNPTVQDLWNSTPAWGFPYINSPLLPAPGVSPIISGALAQRVVGASGYALIQDTVYLEGGAYRGLSDRWLDNVGLYPSANRNVAGGAPYWRLALQQTHGDHYAALGAFGIDVRLRPDPVLPATDRFSDAGVDAVYQFSGERPGALLLNFSAIHEQQDLAATFRDGGAAQPLHHLEQLRLDASYAYRQTWSAGLGLFAAHGSRDLNLYGPAPLTGSRDGSPDAHGYTLQLECVPLGKMDSWGRPWLNLRLGIQYTGYLRFNGGGSDYDGFGRSSRENDSLFVFSWMAF
jgi:hypothetical protein